MKGKKLTVIRYLPETGQYFPQDYYLECSPEDTVLQALQTIYEQQDSSLAFRYGCRYKRCGLCGVMADGKPRLACKVKVADVSEVAPLRNVPLLRDLVVDRTSYFNSLKGLKPYPQGNRSTPLGPLLQDPLHRNLTQCVECLCCVASCPEYKHGDAAFTGPFPFIKLAQMHLDPRDAADRILQAQEWGIKRCQDCGQCICPNGIQLHKAVNSLLG